MLFFSVFPPLDVRRRGVGVGYFVFVLLCRFRVFLVFFLSGFCLLGGGLGLGGKKWGGV